MVAIFMSSFTLLLFIAFAILCYKVADNLSDRIDAESEQRKKDNVVLNDNQKVLSKLVNDIWLEASRAQSRNKKLKSFKAKVQDETDYDDE